MIKFFFIILIFVSNQVFASLKGETLICDKDKIGYNFLSKNIVNVLGINLNESKTFSVKHFYQLTDNVIFIKEQSDLIDQEESLTLRPIGWIFRRNLDYVSLDYVNGDWVRKFSWTCNKTSLDQLEIRINNKLNKLLKANEPK